MKLISSQSFSGQEVKSSMCSRTAASCMGLLSYVLKSKITEIKYKLNIGF